VSRAYLIAQALVSDPQRYEDYKRLAQRAVELYGGRYLVRGGATHLVEGDWNPPRLVILEFDTPELARRFCDSPEYQAAKAARSGAAQMNMLIVEGV
jgi:uncharacterized protein (DUF1330 family)